MNARACACACQCVCVCQSVLCRCACLHIRLRMLSYAPAHAVHNYARVRIICARACARACVHVCVCVGERAYATLLRPPVPFSSRLTCVLPIWREVIARSSGSPLSPCLVSTSKVSTRRAMSPSVSTSGRTTARTCSHITC